MTIKRALRAGLKALAGSSLETLDLNNNYVHAKRLKQDCSRINEVLYQGGPTFSLHAPKFFATQKFI